MRVKKVEDIEALAEEYYPQEWQLAERLAFINGYITENPAKVRRNPYRKVVKYGERSRVLRSMEVGDKVKVQFLDRKDWESWRTTACHLKLTFGARFSVTRDREERDKLNITRYE